MTRTNVKYVYTVLDLSLQGYWFAQNNEDPNEPVELGPDNRLADILTHFGNEGFIISTSGPKRIILVRAVFGQTEEPEEKESPFLGVK